MYTNDPIVGTAVEKGAFIERGKILTATGGGYTVQSLDRDGIVSPPIQPIDNSTYTVDETVYFFLFRDGTGKIVCGA